MNHQFPYTNPYSGRSSSYNAPEPSRQQQRRTSSSSFPPHNNNSTNQHRRRIINNNHNSYSQQHVPPVPPLQHQQHHLSSLSERTHYDFYDDSSQQQPGTSVASQQQQCRKPPPPAAVQQATLKNRSFTFQEDHQQDRPSNEHREGKRIGSLNKQRALLKQAIQALTAPERVLNRMEHNQDVGIRRLLELLQEQECCRHCRRQEHGVSNRAEDESLWSLSLACKLATWVLQTLLALMSNEETISAVSVGQQPKLQDPLRLDEHLAEVLWLLFQATESWGYDEPSLVYAVALLQDENHLRQPLTCAGDTGPTNAGIQPPIMLYQVLQNLMFAFGQSHAQRTALLCWTAMSRHLDRIHQYTSISTETLVASCSMAADCSKWWWSSGDGYRSDEPGGMGQSSVWGSVADIAVRSLIGSDDVVMDHENGNVPVIDQQAAISASVMFLVQFLQYDDRSDNWFRQLESDIRSAFIARVVTEAGKLVMNTPLTATGDSNNNHQSEKTETVTTASNLICLQLICLLLARQDQQDILAAAIGQSNLSWMHTAIEHVWQALLTTVSSDPLAIRTSPSNLLLLNTTTSNASKSDHHGTSSCSGFCSHRLLDHMLGVLRISVRCCGGGGSASDKPNSVCPHPAPVRALVQAAEGRRGIQHLCELLLSFSQQQQQGSFPSHMEQISEVLLFLVDQFPRETRPILLNALQQNQGHENDGANYIGLPDGTLLRGLLRTMYEYYSRNKVDSTIGGTATSALIRLLLQNESEGLLSRDTLSRWIWKHERLSSDSSFLQLCFDTVVAISTSPTVTSLSCRRSLEPIIVCLFDVIYTILRKCDESSPSVLENIPADSIEAMVLLVALRATNSNDVGNRTTVAVSNKLAVDTSRRNDAPAGESDESTPTAGNLSLCREDEEHEMGLGGKEHSKGRPMFTTERQEPVGTSYTMDFTGDMAVVDTAAWLDPCFVRIAAATVLALLGQASLDDLKRQPASRDKTGVDRIVLLQSRMCNTVHSYLSVEQQDQDRIAQVGREGAGGERQQNPSFERTRRRLRLWNTVGSASDNESYLAGLLYASQISQRETILSWKRQALQHQAALEDARRKEHELVAQRQQLEQQSSIRAATFRRQIHGLQRRVEQSAAQAIKVHEAERQHAEQECELASKRAAENEAAAVQAGQKAEACVRAEQQAKDALDRVAGKLEQVTAKERQAVQQYREQQQECTRLSQELAVAQESLLQQEQDLRAQQQLQSEQHHSLVGQEKINREMHESLESLFGDMVALAQMYEHLEKESNVAREKNRCAVQRLEQKLRGYQDRASAWEEKKAQLVYENEVVSKKYSKAREKLDQERNLVRQLQEENQALVREQERRKRAGPMYINQLHDQCNNTSKEHNNTSRNSNKRESSKSSKSRKSSSLREREDIDDYDETDDEGGGKENDRRRRTESSSSSQRHSSNYSTFRRTTILRK